MRTPLLALRMLGRDWRSGELRVLVAAIVIGVGAVTAIGLFSDRLNRAMMFRAAELLGADLMVASARPVDAGWSQHARSLGLRTARTLDFASMVSAGGELQLSGVRAVTDGYPLRGTLRTADEPFQPGVPTQEVPAPGKAWIEGRLTGILGVSPGDRLRVGAAELEIERILVFEPGRGGDFYSMAPRVLIHMDDVPNTKVVQPGSRLSYHYLFAGGEQELDAFRAWLKPRAGEGERLLGVREGNPAAQTALRNSERYLNLASLVAVVLAGVAIAMGTRRYSERHMDHCALLRCFGASGRQVFGVYATQLLSLGAIASLLGCVVGWATHAGILYLLRDLLPTELPPPRVDPLVLGFLAGMIMLPGFGLPAVVRLGRVPVLRVIRRDAAGYGVGSLFSVLVAVAATWCLAWWFTGDLGLALVVVAGGGAVAMVLGIAGYFLLRAARGTRHVAPGIVRSGLQGLLRHPLSSTSQVLAFALAFMAMALVGMLRTDLVSTWQGQMPERAPNQFAVNIFPGEVAPVREFLETRGVGVEQFYPIVRGRLVTLNGQPVREAVTKDRSEVRALNRELNLTWSDRLQIGSRVEAGAWWKPGSSPANSVSVESLLAKRLGIGLGDRLGFRVGSRVVETEVTSIRSVEWDSFRPNFYMVFPPGLLDGLPVTYITSFYLPPERKTVLNELVSEFPSVTLLDVEQLMAQVRSLMDQVSMAIEYILLFVLAAGFAVLAASITASLDERMYEGAVLRALGAGRARIRGQQFTEFLVLGLLSGLLAAAGAELVLWQLYTRLFELDYAPQWPLWVLLPPVAAVLIGIGGALGTRRVVNVAPIQVLREI